jgi:DNA polymerase
MSLRYICDFETASDCDLKVAGAWRYAEHPTTEVLCLCFRSAGGNYRAHWRPGMPLDELRELVENPDTIFVEHASFEQAIWQRIMVEQFGMPPLGVERWEDTQAVCAWKSVPLKLEKGCQALRLSIAKDMEGNKFTIGLSKPDKHGKLNRTPEAYERAIDYCYTDIDCEDALDQRIGQLSPAELGIWRLTETINQRGIGVDLDYVHAMKKVVADATVPMLAKFRKITCGLNPGQREKLIEWSADRGLRLGNMQKKYLAGLLGEQEETNDPTLGYESLAEEAVDANSGGLDAGLRDARVPDDVRAMLECRQVLCSASIKKVDRMLTCVGSDSRARGLQQYHAAGTGRFGGRLLQPHNFPWDKEGVFPKGHTAAKAVAAIMSGDYRFVEAEFGGASAITVVGLSLRHALVPSRGHVYLVGDYSGIEARVVLALAGQYDKCQLMASGYDVYLDMAEDIYNQPKGSWAVTDKALLEEIKKAHGGERTIGKNTVLGCGFQMGGPRFNTQYCPKQPLEFAVRVVASYREVWAPMVPLLWKAFGEAMKNLVAHGIESKVYGCHFHRIDDWACIDLPSGWQRLWYYQPHMHDRPGWGPGAACWTTKSGKWVRQQLYGGLLTENVVQALARGLLCSAMRRVEAAGMPIVLTVHDEIVAEVPEATADMDKFRKLMAEPPAWAEHMRIPISVECPHEPWLRYQK